MNGQTQANFELLIRWNRRTNCEGDELLGIALQIVGKTARIDPAFRTIGLSGWSICGASVSDKDNLN